MRQMIISCGLPKTGTTTLKHALFTLGFKRGGVYEFYNPNAEVFVGDYNVLPLNKFISLDQAFPDAKFIFTTRESASVWYESVERWAQKHKNNQGLKRQRLSMYGSEMPVKDLFVNKYNSHIRNVFEYFTSKYRNDFNDKLLHVSWDRGDDWGALCDFLDVDVPNKPFPHKNKNK